MQLDPVSTSDPSSHLNNETPPLGLRSSYSVTAATPVKRVTFYKSGDAQFGGVRMAIHKRSFKCFDTLLDDLSQRVPLPFGVRTVTTPHGTHTISCLEQLEDGGFYLCSDRQRVKPIMLDTARKQATAWQQNNHSKPSRPDEPPSARSGQRYHRHPKRIVLVKNNDPSLRKSIVLSRRTSRSLRTFIDEISELMQCHIRKLYTLDGRKIDSIQSLMQCPNVLVCVGREPFRPMVMQTPRKTSDERLPGVGSRSRSSICSETHESKKNVNFGLETKKSIIHPRSDSSNRSTRLSVSSEKSFPNGLNTTPGNSGCNGTCPHVKENMMNDDIEKRVLVNKDGSLSVEMKVRFRLLNDETLQWSTEIKKSSGMNNGRCLQKENPDFLQQCKLENSDPESSFICEAKEAYITSHQLRRLEDVGHLKDSHCQNCCTQCHEYDIWKNPLHGEGAIRHVRSSSSNASSHKVVCNKESLDGVHTISQSSEEYMEQVLQNSTCFERTVEGRDTMLEYCTISCCCSHSEKSSNTTSHEGKCASPDNDTRPDSVVSATSKGSDKDHVSVKITMASEERPFSVISHSSKILEELKEDQDNDDDFSMSASRASILSESDQNGDNDQIKSDASNWSIITNKSPQSKKHLSPRPPSKASSYSIRSSKFRNHITSWSSTPEVPIDRGDLEVDTDSAHSITPGGTKPSSRSRQSSNRSCQTMSPDLEKVLQSADANVNDAVAASKLSKRSLNNNTSKGDDQNRRSASTLSASTVISGSTRKSNICAQCGGSKRKTTLGSQVCDHSFNAEEAGLRSTSAMSDRWYASEKSVECMSNSSNKIKTPVLNAKADDVVVKSTHSVAVKTNCSPISPSQREGIERNSTEEQTASVFSDKTNVDGASSFETKYSNMSKQSSKCHCSRSEKSLKSANSEIVQALEEIVGQVIHRITSTAIVKSVKSEEHCSTSERALTPTSATDANEKALSIMSLNSDQYSQAVSGKHSIKDTQISPKSVSSTSTKVSDKPKKSIQDNSHLPRPRDMNASTASVNSVSTKASSKCKTCLNHPEKPSINNDTQLQSISKHGNVYINSLDYSRPVSNASSHSITGTVSIRGYDNNEENDKPGCKSKIIKNEICSDYMNAGQASGSSKAQRKNDRKSATISVTTHTCLCDASTKSIKPHAHHGHSNDSDFSPSISAADFMRETSSHTRPNSGECKTNPCGNRLKAEPCEEHQSKTDGKSKKSSSMCEMKEEHEITGLVPFSLPNASPTEVVHEWLKKIPADSPMYDGEELCIDETEIIALSGILKEQCFPTTLADEVFKTDFEAEDENEEPKKEKTEVNTKYICTDESKESVEMDEHLTPVPKSASRDTLPKCCESSVQVMKVLLSPKLDRCNSLPEVSPVYGRKLSTSAKGLLDCLANLQLIESDPIDVKTKNAKYDELMNILQSLWLCDPSDNEQSNKVKDHRSVDDPKSSSGIDLSSGSAGSGKGSDHDGPDQAQKMDFTQSTIKNVQNETELNTNIVHPSGYSSRKYLNAEEITSDPATPDIASRVQQSLAGEMENEEENQKVEEDPGSNETIRSNGSPKAITETPPTSNKSSENESSSIKSPNETGIDLMDCTNFETPLSIEKAKLVKRPSQDPDPIWVLNLLKKLEDQFMTHYINAMAEFKVRWDLDDSEMLNTMINELRDEVQKRIQLSINRELMKIHCRAGREPKPPLKAISRESSVQTEQRRRRLKVMHNQSVNEPPRQRIDKTENEFSDQKSEDEYCPCETCIKKKIASKHTKLNQIVNSAPVMMDFDLRKILQLKSTFPAKVQAQQYDQVEGSKTADCNKDGNYDGKDLEVLREESEEVGSTDGKTKATNNEEKQTGQENVDLNDQEGVAEEEQCQGDEEKDEDKYIVKECPETKVPEDIKEVDKDDYDETKQQALDGSPSADKFAETKDIEDIIDGNVNNRDAAEKEYHDNSSPEEDEATENDIPKAEVGSINNGVSEDNVEEGLQEETTSHEADKKEDADDSDDDIRGSHKNESKQNRINNDKYIVKSETEEWSNIRKCDMEEDTTESKYKSLKQITKSSIESQPGSIEASLDMEKKMKDVANPNECEG